MDVRPRTPDVRQLVVDLVREANDDPDLEITTETALADGGLELSSLELVRLMVSLEERLDIELDDVAVMNMTFETVDDLIALVAESMS